MSRKRSISVLTVALMAGMSIFASAQRKWTNVKSWPVGGEGGWDYVTIDSATRRIFVTRSTHTQVIDEETGKVLGDIPGQVRAHGVALVPELNRGFITDGGGPGAIIIFDLTTYATLGKLAALPDADGIIYDAKLKKVLAVSGDGNALLTFSPDISPTGKIDPPIALGGAPEFLASDGAGKVYINLEKEDLVAVVDLATRTVIARWPVAPGGTPVGMAIDVEHQRLFVGCRKPAQLVEMSTEGGKVLGSVPIGVGNDATAFMDGQAFASMADGTLVVAEDVGGKFAIEQTVNTAKGSRTLGVDAVTHTIILPMASFEAPATAGARPKMKAGSFGLLEVDGSK